MLMNYMTTSDAVPESLAVQQGPTGVTVIAHTRPITSETVTGKVNCCPYQNNDLNAVWRHKGHTWAKWPQAHFILFFLQIC